MANVTQESIELARQLWAIFDEAWPDGAMLTWDDLQPYEREAWVQVAQFVEAREKERENIKHRPMKERTPFSGHIYYLNPNESPDHR